MIFISFIKKYIKLSIFCNKYIRTPFKRIAPNLSMNKHAIFRYESFKFELQILNILVKLRSLSECSMDGISIHFKYICKINIFSLIELYIMVFENIYS